MQNSLLFNGKNMNLKGYDANTDTLNINDVSGEVYHLTFDGYLPSHMTINLVNSNVTIIEMYKGSLPECNFTINIDENSSLKRFSVLVENESNQIIKRDVNNEGNYQSMQLDLTTFNIDSTENINMNKKGAESSVIDGIYASLNANKKYQTNLNHYQGESTSNAKIFAINADKAHVSIYTDGFIKNGASRSKAFQEGRIINLTDTCGGIVLPNLHIDENDVEAAHSCSVGSVNKEHMYYLQTRGLSETQAKNILIRGYFNPLLKNIDDEDVLKEIVEVLDKRIG